MQNWRLRSVPHHPSLSAAHVNEPRHGGASAHTTPAHNQQARMRLTATHSRAYDALAAHTKTPTHQFTLTPTQTQPHTKGNLSHPHIPIFKPTPRHTPTPRDPRALTHADTSHTHSHTTPRTPTQGLSAHLLHTQKSNTHSHTTPPHSSPTQTRTHAHARTLSDSLAHMEKHPHKPR